MTRAAMRSTRKLAAVSAVLALAGWEPFRAPDPDVDAGNRAYAEHRYRDAIAAYDRAEDRGGAEREGIAFDRGTAELAAAEQLTDPALKSAMLAKADADLRAAGGSTNPIVRGEASYNRGNAALRAGKLDDAIAAYKQALRDDPASEDARTNLELALRKRDKQQKPQPQSGQGQGQPKSGQGQSQNQPPQNGSGSGQSQPQNGSGNGSGQTQPPQNGSGNGSGQTQPPQNGSGNGSGQTQPPQNGSGNGSAQTQPPQNGSNAQSNGPPQNGSNAQDGSPGGHHSPSGHPQRSHGNGASPKSPTERKLDDLEQTSRGLQRNNAREHASGQSDLEHDW